MAKAGVKAPKVFVSYSRIDLGLVTIMVKMLRVGMPIFRDVDNLGPGDKWKPTITKAISQCGVFMLFWCWHSKVSKAVKAEWRQALAEDKRIVPILMDATPLPVKLRQFQWIDVSELMDRHQKRFSYKKGAGKPATAGRRIIIHHLIEPTHGAGLTIRRELWRVLQAD
jgi:hypothetical protein